MIDMEKLFQDHNIPTADQGDRHYRSGWVHTPCPFCSSSYGSHEGNHLGFNLESGFFHCWRCGWHSISEVVQRLLKLKFTETKEILAQYGHGDSPVPARKKEKAPILESIKIPGKPELKPMHIKYLEGRGFDVDELVSEWEIKGTDGFAKYGMKWRVTIPIHDASGKIVSWTSRAVNNYAKATRYISCEKNLEILNHKSCLYGLHKVPQRQKNIIVVEGPIDVWKMGAGNAVATFGIEFTKEQIQLLVSRFTEIIVAFDPEEKAHEKGRELCIGFMSLSGKKHHCSNLYFPGCQSDPGSLPLQVARNTAKKILGKVVPE